MNLVFLHKCGTECPANDMEVTISSGPARSSYYVMPEVRCVYTNNILQPVIPTKSEVV